MNADYFRTLYDYCYWARDRLFDAAEGMTEEEYARPNGFTYNGLRAILTHALGGEQIWLTRFLGETPSGFLQDSDVPKLGDLKGAWSKEEGRMRQFLAALTDAELERDVVARRRSGEEIHTPLWALLLHVANHGTQHRSEAAEALTLIGRSPGSLDFTTYFWERQNQAAKAGELSPKV